MARLIVSLPLWLASTAAIAAVPNAQALWDAGNYRQAFAAAVEPAQAGDPQAEFLLGEAYRLGRSVDQDLIQAREWYARAARQGDVASAAALGELLVGMRRSSEAVPWLTLAASHNHPRATAFLAAIYYTGDGAEQDLILATSLMKKAAAEGSPEARAKLAMMDDTAAPVDVSSPEPATRSNQLAMRDTAPAIQAAAPAPRAVREASAAASTLQPPAPPPAAPLPIVPRASETASLPVRVSYKVRTQVGAFRSAANAHRALALVSARMSGTAFHMTIVQTGGFYRVLLISDGKRSAIIARARLMRVRWQHFVPHPGVARA
jgi:hypothetical protein